MNVWDIIISVLILSAVVMAFIIMAKDRKRGKGCCKDCENCRNCKR